MRSSATDPTAAFLGNIRSAIVAARLIPRNATCVVAVSGGADSTSLLDALVQLRPTWRGSVRALHLDHGFRPGSARDADVVRRLADKLGIPCDVVTVDGRAFAREHHLGLEHTGRFLRYRALAEAVARHQPGVAVTGHTRDDSVESVLLHLIRGTGLDGLRGIRGREVLEIDRLGPVVATSADERPRPTTDRASNDVAGATVAVVRPLLGVTRFETAGYCTARNLTWVVDPTNDDPALLRNRVRHNLLPLLRTYNPAIDAAIARTAAVLDEDAAWLDALTERRWTQAAASDGDSVALPLSALRRGPRAASRRLVRRALAAIGNSTATMSFDAVERALGVAAPDGPRRAALGGRVIAEQDAEGLVFWREGEDER